MIIIHFKYLLREKKFLNIFILALICIKKLWKYI